MDLGLVQIAATSDGGGFSGAAIEDNRRKFGHRRSNLQKKQTRSATRKLKKNIWRSIPFSKTTNHRISKILVQIAYDTHRAIALKKWAVSVRLS
ncbi:MAG: hypothetical protein IPJ46_12455 [Anaerolineales bacterium]|nr:hypothetical protein [Anaerolineales bacterium]